MGTDTDTDTIIISTILNRMMWSISTDLYQPVIMITTRVAT